VGAQAVFNSFANTWGFLALPGNVSLTYQGMTAESTPREVWHAAVPAADGTARLYCNDASTGEFTPVAPYGTSFASTETGWAETIGDSAVHYDVYGVVEQVVRGQSVHTYTRDPGGAWVDIEANTAMPSKQRYNLSGGVVQSVSQYAQLSGSGWTETRRLAVSQWGGQISQLTSYPGGRTTSFSYNGDGTLASYQDCSGRTWHLQYEGA
jgi:YD repeat-containing protein